jgi:putative spermidine/putrescine transport system permease protein
VFGVRRLAPWLLLAPAILVIALFLLAPVIGTLASTFGTRQGVFAPYIRFLSSGFSQTVLWRTLEVALITTAISILIGFPTAYVIARSRSAWRSVLIVAAVFPLLTSTVVRSFAWMVILGRNGLINKALLALGITAEPVSLLYTETAVVIGLVYLFTPLMILSLVGVLENIEPDLLQASNSLGAGPRATFLQVILPLATPGLIVGAVLVFTGSFTAYTTPQLLGGQRQTVLATLLYQRAMVSFDWVGASTIAAIMVVITVTVVLGFSRLARRANPAAA